MAIDFKRYIVIYRKWRNFMETEDYDDFGHGWHHRHMFRGLYGPAKRGDMTPIILQTLSERPMHGYEIIRELEKKSHGFWRPSPGSVYPTLQLLEEQDFVTGNDVGGKKVYELTKLGQDEAAKTKTQGPWPHHGKSHDFTSVMALRATFMELIGTVKTVAMTADDDAQKKALAILKEATEKLQSLQSQPEGEDS
jgi:DNA-binding PadR family transcriptional regulator